MDRLAASRNRRAGTDPKVCAAAIHRYCDKILDNIDDITSVEGFFLDDAETVVVAYGSVSRSALSAVRRARDDQRDFGVVHAAGSAPAQVAWPSLRPSRTSVLL